MQREQIVDKLVQLLFELSDELTKIEGANRHDLWPLHPDRQVREGYERARELNDRIFTLVMEQNDKMLAEDTVLSRLLYGVAAIRMELPISDDELREIAIRKINELLDYEGYRNVDVPLVSLEIENGLFQFGPVQIISTTDEDKDDHWWLRAKTSLGDSINNVFLSYARVNVPGDAHTAVHNAIDQVNEALRILRGIGFPITAKEINQIGVINEFPGWRNIPFRLHKPIEKIRVDPQPRQVTTIGPTRIPYNLQGDLLSGIAKSRMASLLQLLDQYGFNSGKGMTAKLLTGWSWLGESTKPDTLSSRFAKTAFSLESFIGGESNEYLLTTRGLTATLAERAAFLVSDEPDRRLEIDTQVRKNYAIRSAIAHGTASEVSEDDLVAFGTLVREIGWSLLDKLDNFSSVDELQLWVKKQKYN